MSQSLLSVVTGKDEPKFVGHGQELGRLLEDLVVEFSFRPKLDRPHLDELEVVDVLGSGRHRDRRHLGKNFVACKRFKNLDFNFFFIKFKIRANACC